MPCERQLLIRMFSRIHLNLPIESANKNTQNSEMNSACFCPRFSSLKNGRKNGIINFRKNNLHGGLTMPYDQKTRDALQAYYETHDFTGNIPAFDDKKYTPAQLRKLQRCLYSPETFYSLWLFSVCSLSEALPRIKTGESILRFVLYKILTPFVKNLMPSLREM